MPSSSRSEVFFTAGYDSPVGHLELAMSERGLTGLAFGSRWSIAEEKRFARREEAKAHWVEQPERFPPHQAKNGLDEDPGFSDVRRQLDEYFSGTRRLFDLPLDLRGPEFYLRCWHTLLRIPYGETWSYARLAAEVGSPRSFRAVGQANHHNPIAIIVPCHRVIAGDGSLAGFGGGLAVKEFLLKLEGARFRPAIPVQRELFGEAGGMTAMEPA